MLGIRCRFQTTLPIDQMIARLSADFLGGATELWNDWGKHQSSIDSQGFDLFIGERGRVPPYVARGRFHAADQSVELTVRPHRSFTIGIGIMAVVAAMYSIWVWLSAAPADKTALQTILTVWGCGLAAVVILVVITMLEARKIGRAIRERLKGEG